MYTDTEIQYIHETYIYNISYKAMLHQKVRQQEMKNNLHNGKVLVSHIF